VQHRKGPSYKGFGVFRTPYLTVKQGVREIREITDLVHVRPEAGLFVV
jgi:hypothetical protein